MEQVKMEQVKMERVLVYGMTDNPGGIETYLVNMLCRLPKDEMIFDFVTDFKTMAYDKKVLGLGCHIYYISKKSESLWKHWKGLWKVLHKHREYQTVYFNILDAGAVFAMLIPWLLGRTVVTHSHNGATNKVTLHTICRPFLEFMTKSYLACSELAAEFMFGKRIVEQGKVIVIPNAINAAEFEYDVGVRTQMRSELQLESKFAICHVGRLSQQKNPLGLIDIFEALLRKEPSAVLISVGSGEMEQEVHQYVVNKGLQKEVIFLGVRRDIEKIMQAVDVFLLPSFYEGLPIVGIEAQAAGLPCVLADTISREVDITGNVCFLPLADSPEEWAEEIRKKQRFSRKSTKQKIIEAGYDMAHSDNMTQVLVKTLSSFK